VNAVEVFGPGALPSFVGLLIAGLAMAIAAAARAVFAAGVGAAAAGVVTTFLIVAAAPQPFQTFYWLSGAANYVPPLILGATAVALAAQARRDPRARWLAALALVGFVGAGFSEAATAFALAVGVLLLGFAAIGRPELRTALPAVSIFVIASIGGAVIVALAPGNLARFAQLPPPDLSRAIALTPGESAGRVAELVAANIGLEVFVVLLVATLAWARRLPSLPPRGFLAATLAALVLVPVTIFPALWATSTEPRARTLVYLAALLLAWFATLGWATGSVLGRRSPLRPGALGAAALVLAIVPLATFVDVQAARSELGRWAAGQDQLDKLLANSAHGTVEATWKPIQAHGLLAVDLRPPGSDPKLWVNDCLARFHHLDALIVRP
jgi:hypothetical protein